jgi:alkylation response protein AidB-like acyl-CoA dehydrogenase
MQRGGSFLLEPVGTEIFTRERFSEEHREIDRMVREFAKERIHPNREAMQTLNKDLQLQLMREVGELGLTAIDIPERYGGLERDKTTAALVVEALTMSGSADWVVTFSVQTGIGSLAIVYFGTDAQKEKYLPKLGTAEHIGAYALTEPGAGSDAMNVKATAQPIENGEAFVLNGTKQYITNGGWAEIFTVFAQLEGKGMTAFIVERDSEGFSIGAEEQKMGIKGSSTVNLTLENVRVPKENLLGKPGEGGNIALSILNIGRFKLGAAVLGACKTCTDYAVQYSQERQQFGQPIAFFQAIRKKLGDMLVRTYMLDSVIYRTVGLMDQAVADLDHDDPEYYRKVMDGLEEYAIEASISKILGSETLFRISDHGIQVLGGYGFSEEYPMARVFRNTRIDRIWEGTNEVNRLVIYGYYLKKALMEELPLRDSERSWTRAKHPKDTPLAWELEALDTSRRLTLKCLHEAITLYGQDLRNEQVVGEDLADLVIGYYAGSSGISRLLQLGNDALNDPAHRALARLIAFTALEDAWRIYYRLRPTLLADKYAEGTTKAFERQMKKLHPPFDPVQELHVLTDDLLHHGRYPFE